MGKQNTNQHFDVIYTHIDACAAQEKGKKKVNIQALFDQILFENICFDVEVSKKGATLTHQLSKQKFTVTGKMLKKPKQVFEKVANAILYSAISTELTNNIQKVFGEEYSYYTINLARTNQISCTLNVPKDPKLFFTLTLPIPVFNVTDALNTTNINGTRIKPTSISEGIKKALDIASSNVQQQFNNHKSIKGTSKNVIILRKS